ncbi:TOBE domain-containing protein [Sulfurimonas sp.]
MNHIEATITKIEQYDSVSAVFFSALGLELSMVSLELNPALKVGVDVKLGVKATNISLSKKIHDDISISNQLEGVVQTIDNGTILSSVKVQIKDIFLESIINRKSVIKLDLKDGDKIVALIKASDLAIVEIL